VLRTIAGGAERVLLPTGSSYPTLSPASDEIAYWQSGGDGTKTLKVTTLDGQSTRTLIQPISISDAGGINPVPAWSPDAKSIAFNYQRNVVKVSAKSQGPLTPVVPAQARANAVTPSFSPDGTRLVYLQQGSAKRPESRE